ncbi:MAG: V-type ATP synthase subunit F [Candidatus Poseidoniales archaeon]|jgi:V/A-type H+-transporting ATPase subunit F|tara:strand:- start:5379 stop:5678 length:300 start_codon:yes stop_codon:yes gene_type:complete
MQIAVVGSHDFTLGFQLAGVLKLYNPKNLEEMTKTMKSLLNEKEVGVIVIDNSELLRLPERLRTQLSESITPTVLGIGTEEDNTLRESIKSALGVDLWK